MVISVPDLGVEQCRRCGHVVDDHQHYRPGTDCGPCRGACPSYVGQPGPARLAVRFARTVRDLLYGVRLLAGALYHYGRKDSR
jgi:hypothetical protein